MAWRSFPNPRRRGCLQPVAAWGVWLALSGCGATAEPASAPLPPSALARAPDLGELRQLLTPHGAQAFDPAAVSLGCPTDQALGEYVAMLVENGTPSPAAPDDVRRLSGGCSAVAPGSPRAPVDPPLDPAYWDCRIESYTSDAAGESPWHYELRLRVRRADRAVDLEHLSCPGSP